VALFWRGSASLFSLVGLMCAARSNRPNTRERCILGGGGGSFQKRGLGNPRGTDRRQVGPAGPTLWVPVPCLLLCVPEGSPDLMAVDLLRGQVS